MPWYIYALLASLLFAVVPLQKRKHSHSPKAVMFWSSLFAFLLVLVLFPIVDFPKTELFYLGAVFAGFSGVFGGILQFKLSEKNMARTMPIQVPVQILTCFVFFCLLQPSYSMALFSNIYGLIAILVCLVALVVASQYLRRADNTLETIITVTPVSLLFGAIIVYYKIVMDMVPGHASNIILAYIMIHYFTIATCFLVENIVNKTKVNISEQLTSHSLIMAVLYVFAYYFLFTAVYYSTNPAFAIAFNLLIPVWIKIYSLIAKTEDDADIRFAVIILLAISIMALIG